jgi:hypothetical protein
MLRLDSWWVELLPVAVMLSAFEIYATFVPSKGSFMRGDLLTKAIFANWNFRDVDVELPAFLSQRGIDNVLMILRSIALKSFSGIVAVALATCVYTSAQTKAGPVDPGVRGGAAGAGDPLKDLTADEAAFFQDGLTRFAQVEAVTKGANNGLGRPLQLKPVSLCHAQPSAGGSSPSQNPPQGFEPRLIGSEPCPPLFCHSAVNYLKLPKRPVFTGDKHYSSTSNYRDVLSRILGGATWRRSSERQHCGNRCLF